MTDEPNGALSPDEPADDVLIVPAPADPVPGEAGWHTPPALCAFAKLTVKRQGTETDVVFSISPPATIGRFDPSVGPVDVDLADLPEGAYVSRKHARLACEDGRWTIKDLGSSNGTFLLKDDFEKVDEAELADGDEFALGNARFVFRLAEA